jgi:antitoxin HigA-1
MPPIYPGEVLLEEFIVSLARLSTGWPSTSAYLRGASMRSCMASAAYRRHRVAELGRYVGTTAQFWISLQSRYDLDIEQDNLGAALDLISPLRSA